MITPSKLADMFASIEKHNERVESVTVTNAGLKEIIGFGSSIVDPASGMVWGAKFLVDPSFTDGLVLLTGVDGRQQYWMGEDGPFESRPAANS